MNIVRTIKLDKPGNACTSFTLANSDGDNKLTTAQALGQKYAKWWNREAGVCDSYSIAAPMAAACRKIATEYSNAL